MKKRRVAAQTAQVIRPAVCEHHGKEIAVGPYTVLVGGAMYLQPEDLRRADVLAPLLGKMPDWWEFGRTYHVLALPLPDMGGVPDGWGDLLVQQVLPLLAEGKRLLAFCAAGHGRTGTFLASLVSILEPRTPDPIAAVRVRYCQHAVETIQQAKAVFALRDQPLPAQYETEFWRKSVMKSRGIK